MQLKMIVLIVVMALITYLIRMIPLVFFRKKITSNFIKSILYYMPYAVLSAMTFPYVFYSTGNIYTALAGTAIALIASSGKLSLIVVAILACLTVLITGFII